MLSHKRWEIEPAAPVELIARFSHLHPLIAQLLCNRGITEPAAADAFLNGTTHFEDPFRMTGMEAAVERIRAAISPASGWWCTAISTPTA